MFRIFKKEKSLKSFIKKLDQKQKSIVIAMFDYAEGRIGLDEIKNVLFSEMDTIDRLFLFKVKRYSVITEFEIPELKRLLQKEKFSFDDECEFYRIILVFFKRRGIQGNYYNETRRKEELLLSFFPEWVYPDKELFLSKYGNEVEWEQPEETLIEWGREKVLTLYKYEDMPPEWAQDEIWPTYKGVPMIFVKQKEKGEKVIYYFKDESGEKVKTISQYY